MKASFFRKTCLLVSCCMSVAASDWTIEYGGKANLGSRSSTELNCSIKHASESPDWKKELKWSFDFKMDKGEIRQKLLKIKMLMQYQPEMPVWPYYETFLQTDPFQDLDREFYHELGLGRDWSTTPKNKVMTSVGVGVQHFGSQKFETARTFPVLTANVKIQRDFNERLSFLQTLESQVGMAGYSIKLENTIHLKQESSASSVKFEHTMDLDVLSSLAKKNPVTLEQTFKIKWVYEL